MRRTTATVALLALVVIAGCGEKTVDADSAEESIAGLISDQTGFDPDDLECPDDVKAEAGTTFECDFTGPDGPYTASVRITAVEGERVEFFVESRPSG